MFSKLTKQKSISVSSLVFGSVLCLLAGVSISSAIDQYQAGGRMAAVANAQAPAVSKGCRISRLSPSESVHP